MDVLGVPTLCPVTLTNGHNRDLNCPFFSYKITQHILNVTFTKEQAKMWASFKIFTCRWAKNCYSACTLPTRMWSGS